MKAIVNWKLSRGVILSSSDHRLDISTQHSAVKLCIFCTQFFDSNYADLVDTNDIKIQAGIYYIIYNI